MVAIPASRYTQGLPPSEAWPHCLSKQPGMCCQYLCPQLLLVQLYVVCRSPGVKQAQTSPCFRSWHQQLWQPLRGLTAIADSPETALGASRWLYKTSKPE